MLVLVVLAAIVAVVAVLWLIGYGDHDERERVA